MDQVTKRQYTGLYVASGNAAARPLTLYTFNRGLDPNQNNSGFKDDLYSQLVRSPHPCRSQILVPSAGDAW